MAAHKSTAGKQTLFKEKMTAVIRHEEAEAYGRDHDKNLAESVADL